VTTTTRKQGFSGCHKRPQSAKFSRKVKKLANLPAAMIGRKNHGR
jgi:hypothetical protein